MPVVATAENTVITTDTYDAIARWLAGYGHAGTVALGHPAFSSPQILHWRLEYSAHGATQSLCGAGNTRPYAAALEDACARCPDLTAITELAHGFTHLVRQRRGAQLEDWIAKACAGPIAEIRSFANSLTKDFDAVNAGLTLTWNSEAVEGAVNRVIMWNLVCQDS
jgi:hypothetical protein